MPMPMPMPMLSLVAGALGGAGNIDGIGSAARFVAPDGVAIDGAGNFFVPDRGNNTIRKVVISTGAVTTLAGTAGMPGSADGTGAAARFNDPYGVAVDGAGNLFVADWGNSTIRKVVTSTGVVTTIVGVAGQQGVKLGMLPGGLNRPWGVAVSPAGAFFIADAEENVILSASNLGSGTSPRRSPSDRSPLAPGPPRPDVSLLRRAD